MKKKDWLLLLPILLIALFLFLINQPNAGQEAMSVRIWVDSKVYGEFPLENGKEIIIEQDSGEQNVLHLTENGFYMHFSSCHNQLCISQGEVTQDNYAKRALGTHIICLPNRVDAELILSETSESPLIPDV